MESGDGDVHGREVLRSLYSMTAGRRLYVKGQAMVRNFVSRRWRLLADHRYLVVWVGNPTASILVHGSDYGCGYDCASVYDRGRDVCLSGNVNASYRSSAPSSMTSACLQNTVDSVSVNACGDGHCAHGYGSLPTLAEHRLKPYSSNAQSVEL